MSKHQQGVRELRVASDIVFGNGGDIDLFLDRLIVNPAPYARFGPAIGTNRVRT